jgi:hypothetical protein
MIIWSGLGFLVAVIVFAISLAMNMIVDGIYGAGTYGAQPLWFAVTLLISSPCIWGLGTALQKNTDQVVIDKQTGQELTINRSNHRFFFIPMKYWALAALAGAVIILGKTALDL